MRYMLILLTCLVNFTGHAAFKPTAFYLQTKVLTESQKIEHLLKYVESLKGAMFIRNGESHPPAEAAAHLRMKWEKAGNKVKTAVDFIEICASKSSMSGKPYMIKMPDGKELPARDVLMRELKRIQQK